MVCARVRFAAGPAVRWEPAPFAGCGAESVYEVFHDIGCFFDAAARAAVDEATTQVWGEAMAHNQESGWMWHVAEVGDAKTSATVYATGRLLGLPGRRARARRRARATRADDDSPTRTASTAATARPCAPVKACTTDR